MSSREEKVDRALEVQVAGSRRAWRRMGTPERVENALIAIGEQTVAQMLADMLDVDLLADLVGALSDALAARREISVEPVADRWFSRVIVSAGDRKGELVTPEEVAASQLSWDDYALCRFRGDVTLTATIHSRTEVDNVVHALNGRDAEVAQLRAQVLELAKENKGLRIGWRKAAEELRRLTADFQRTRDYVSTMRDGLHALGSDGGA